jgi:heme/copper-type cytochrome/quinol oxidase subunit 3
MLLFLLSEAALFFPFFWAFFHGALSPAISIGAI